MVLKTKMLSWSWRITMVSLITKKGMLMLRYNIYPIFTKSFLFWNLLGRSARFGSTSSFIFKLVYVLNFVISYSRSDFIKSINEKLLILLVILIAIWNWCLFLCGKIAIGTDDVYRTAEAVKLSGGKVTREPGPLPGINTKITACLDPDGWKTVSF